MPERRSMAPPKPQGPPQGLPQGLPQGPPQIPPPGPPPVPQSPPAAAPTQLAERAYAQLLDMLGGEGMVRDMRLPGEIALAQQLEVSRPVLRQALARLRAEGRIYSRKGSGNFVGAPLALQLVGFGPLSSIPDMRAFLEFRCTLESESAALAATRHDAAAIRELQLLRRRFERVTALGQPGIEEDIEFHAAVARASGNRFYAITMAALAEQTRVGIHLVRQLADRPLRDRLAEVQREHARIAAAIGSGDPEAARQAMAAHLRGGLARLFGR